LTHIWCIEKLTIIKSGFLCIYGSERPGGASLFTAQERIQKKGGWAMNIYISERGLFSNDAHDYPISHSAPVSSVKAVEPVSDNVSVAREAQTSFVAENTPAYNISISSMGKAALVSMNELSKGFDEYYDNLLATRNEAVTSEENAANTVPEENEGADSYNVQEESAIPEATDNFVNRFEPEANNFTQGAGAIENEEIDTALTGIYDNETVEENVSNVYEAQVSSGEVPEEAVPGRIEAVDEVIAEPEMYGIENGIATGVSNAEFEPGADRLLEEPLEVREEQQEVQEESRVENNPVIRQALAAYNYQMAFQINMAMTQ